MSISTEWEMKNIRQYAEILEKIDDLKMQISLLHDELINLSVCMTKEDIEEAIDLYEHKYDNAPI